MSALTEEASQAIAIRSKYEDLRREVNDPELVDGIRRTVIASQTDVELFAKLAKSVEIE